MTFTAEPNIGPYLVEATPPNLLEHIDEHIKFLRECKITFTGSIGRGDIPVYPRVCGVDSLVFNVFNAMRGPFMQIAYLFSGRIVLGFRRSGH